MQMDQYLVIATPVVIGCRTAESILSGLDLTRQADLQSHVLADVMSQCILGTPLRRCLDAMPTLL